MNRKFLQALRALALRMALLAAAGGLSLPARGADAPVRSVFAVDPLVDGAQREMPLVAGVLVEGRARFPVPEGVRVFAFPNGELDELAAGWPRGGWGRFDRDGFAALIAAVNYSKAGVVPKPADYAAAAGMPLGEFDFLIQKTGADLNAALWGGAAVLGGVELVTAEAPAGKNLLRMGGGPGALLRTPDFPVSPNRPYFVSFWVRATGKALGVLWLDVSRERRSGTVAYEFVNVPATGGEWRRVGYYFFARPQAASARILFTSPGPGQSVDYAGFEVREAAADEMQRARLADRATQPANLPTALAGKGRHLALSRAKLAGKAGVPGRPFVVWAIGSSWTAGLGHGEDLRRMVGTVYPNAPEIVYYGRMGSGAPYDVVRGWAMTGVARDQPDLVISYTNGSPGALAEMLESIRTQTTADIIVPSLHFTRNDALVPANIDPPELDALREVCAKYGAQFVENRRELAEWLLAKGKQPVDLLRGPNDVHQNRLGATLTNENIWRHLLAPIDPAEIPADRERVISLPAAWQNGGGPGLRFAGKWRLDSDWLVADSADARIEFSFIGNRLDVLGEAGPGGGTLEATVNGAALAQLPAFGVSIIQQPDTNAIHGSGPIPVYPRSSGGAQATGPHGITLGRNIVAQSWKFEMIDNRGNFRLVGSKTGPDGEGNALRPWVSNSGQIILDPRLWRYANMALFNRPDRFSNHPGDSWPFEVTHEVSGPISFRAAAARPVDATLFKLAPNASHTVVLAPKGGAVRLRGLVAYRPPMAAPGREKTNHDAP
jgi:hypothetical protein